MSLIAKGEILRAGSVIRCFPGEKKSSRNHAGGTDFIASGLACSFDVAIKCNPYRSLFDELMQKQRGQFRRSNGSCSKLIKRLLLLLLQRHTTGVIVRL